MKSDQRAAAVPNAARAATLTAPSVSACRTAAERAPVSPHGAHARLALGVPLARRSPPAAAPLGGTLGPRAPDPLVPSRPYLSCRPHGPLAAHVSPAPPAALAHNAEGEWAHVAPDVEPARLGQSEFEQVSCNPPYGQLTDRAAEAAPLMDVVPPVASVSPQVDVSVSPLVVPGTSFDDLGLGQDFTTADMTPSAMQILFAPPAPTAHRGPNVEPRDVQRRFNAPLDPRAELAGIIPAPVLATLSDTDARLFYHYIDVQATISVGVETEDNPLSTYFIPVALSAALGESNGDNGPNDGNPAFHALKACAATHRANLMDGTGTDGSAAFRQVAQSARKRAYALLAERIEVLSRASPLEREQFAGALAITADTPSANELFFISAISLYQAWYNFNLVVILDQPLMPLLCEMARDPLTLSPPVEDVFAVPPGIALEHMRVYHVIREYRGAMRDGAENGRRELAAQVEADELVTSLGHAICADLEARDREPRGEGVARRKAVGRLLHHAALRALLLREVFHCSRTDTAVQECVAHALSSLQSIKWGTESGLLIPLMVLSTAALERERLQFRDFMVRLCWKGSVGPRAALRTLDMVIDDKALDWRDALRKVPGTSVTSGAPDFQISDPVTIHPHPLIDTFVLLPTTSSPPSTPFSDPASELLKPIPADWDRSEIPPPVPKEGEVLIDVYAAGLNFFDAQLTSDKPPLPFVLGVEFSGRVAQDSPIPPGCPFKRGDRVMGRGLGAYAEQVAVPVSSLLPLPEELSYEQGAAFYVAYPTSYEALVGRAHAKKGETVLVHAAAGGVGVAAVQIAKSLGCTVIGTAGADAKRAAAKAAGCDHVVDYTLPDWPQQVKALTRDRGVDVVYDPVGLLIPSLKCVAWNARLLVVGFAGGTIEKIPANLVLLKNVSVVGVRGGEAARKDPERGKRTIKECFRMITEGMRPVIHGRVYEGLGELAEGLGDLENRKVTGKAVSSKTLQKPGPLVGGTFCLRYSVICSFLGDFDMINPGRSHYGRHICAMSSGMPQSVCPYRHSTPLDKRIMPASANAVPRLDPANSAMKGERAQTTAGKGATTPSSEEEYRTLGTLLLAMQKVVDSLEKGSNLAPSPSRKAVQARNFQLLQSYLGQAVSKVDAIHRVDSASILPAILYGHSKTPPYGTVELRANCESAIAQMRGNKTPLRGTTYLDTNRVQELESKLWPEQIINALEFSLGNLEDGVVTERNSAAHPIKDILSLLEWEIGSLRRISDPAERLRKADALHILCVCATAAPHSAKTLNVQTILQDLREELGLGAFSTIARTVAGLKRLQRRPDR
ncbi:alcohol dehydrogenase [Trichosporon asahii var. asahii CBS 2479]|uniref:Alcohol dehydrogenase n=1 Tax=Trichosporon asahii var. asahii (strain ATCC 90039 / CBS 2479 / JCM 2466 / KCTC 7840 / NBRC 103889/ NCYC 2677 / UAMH 7654) TaxID=1186058 RepID=J5R5W3_TRIAS|nr:alcohol dehydrogenase [Trichosporon asahii var. asahii CBS 2479]EJT50863.1 alcohol dehydrogenase [Trichosporon asahii var. asahii CBS 2479]